jgi:hypothetical protein
MAAGLLEDVEDDEDKPLAGFRERSKGEICMTLGRRCFFEPQALVISSTTLCGCA